LQSRGERREAHEIVAEAYGVFSEGLERPDLTAASALLAELG
jgi:hypothetical protein